MSKRPLVLGLMWLVALAPCRAAGGLPALTVPAGGDRPGDIAHLIRVHRVFRTIVVVDAGVGSGFSAPVTGSAAGWLMLQRAKLADAHVVRGSHLFSVGVGLRLTHLRLADPTSFTGRGGAAGQALAVAKPQLTACNVAVQARCWLLGYPARHPLALGFSIDVAGLSFGPAREAQSSTGQLPGLRPETRPVRGNLLLVNTRDRGTLNSEFYLSYKAAPRLTVRAGWAHVASGYEFDGARYQRFSNLAFVGLSVGVGGVWRYY